MHLKKQLHRANERGHLAAESVYPAIFCKGSEMPICPYPFKSSESTAFWEGFNEKMVWLAGYRAPRHGLFSSTNPYTSCEFFSKIWLDGYEAGAGEFCREAYAEGGWLDRENPYPEHSPEFYGFLAGRKQAVQFDEMARRDRIERKKERAAARMARKRS